MIKRIVHGMLLLVFLFSGLAVTPSTRAAAKTDSKGVSPEALLNTDGTLKLDSNFRGALDLEGWNVKMDAARGPILSPIASTDNWAAIDEGGGPFKNFTNAVLVDGINVYVGGELDNIASNPEADGLAMWNGSEWTSLSNGGAGQSAIRGGVEAFYLYNGKLYVGGWFPVYNTNNVLINNANNLAIWDGSVWSALPGITTPINGEVRGLGFDSTNHILYFGGDFTDVNGNGAADYIAGIDLDTSTLVTLGSNGAGDGSINNSLYGLGVDSTGKVYIGGFFQNVNNGGVSIPEADYIAMWNGANWSALGNTSPGVGAWQGLVGTITIDGSDDVYVGGWDDNVAGIAEADWIAKWDGASWFALGSNGAGDGALGSLSGGTPVQEILVNGSDVYVGGFFSLASDPTGNFIARFNTGTNTWSSLGNNGAGSSPLNDGVYGMAFSSGKLYAVGEFGNVNNQGTVLTTADKFAIWNGINWSTLGQPDGSFNFGVDAIAVMGSDVYVSGNFTNLTGDPRIDHIARWDGTKWNPVGNFSQDSGSIYSRVRSLAVDGTDLYAGGDFIWVENEGVNLQVNRIAKWDTLTNTWSALGSGVNNIVYAIAVDASHNVYIGGSFTNTDGIAEADYIAMWNGSSWNSLSGNGASNGALSGNVYAIVLSGSNVYVGGTFTTVRDTSNAAIPNAVRLAKWNGSVWSAMDGVTSPLSDAVFAMALSGTDLYIGGNFNSLNGMNEISKVAKWDGATWSALGNNGSGGGSLNGGVYSIATGGSYVFVGGVFSDIYNGFTQLAEADNIARWDGSNWSAMGSNSAGDGSIDLPVYALAVVEDDVWAGGDFENVNNNGSVVKAADHLAAFGIDLTPPTVVSSNRAEPTPTAAAALDFTVTFSEFVTGVDATDFIVTKTGSVSGATVSGFSGSGSSYTVTVNTGNGGGTIRLDLKASGTSIIDAVGNPIAGGFTSGQVYAINKTLTYKSDGANDGWVLESTETSGVGGTMNSSTTTFNIGDDAAKKQYRAILHFDTSSLPDNATITKVTLKIKKQGLAGTDPFTILGGLLVDMRKPSFGAIALALTDFQSAAGRTAIATFDPTPVSNWYSAVLNASGKNYVNKTGTTQFRLRFATDDNNNAIADFMKFFSGNAGSGSRPQLIVEYKVP